MKNILITGGAGFIGSTLADRLLQEEKRVIVIDNFNDYYDVNLKKQRWLGQKSQNKSLTDATR